MSLKRKDTIDHPIQTDVAEGRMIGRDYRSLLRSTGHLKRRGLWQTSEDPFHVYREEENPGLGALRTFIGPRDYFRGYDPQFPQFGEPGIFNWRPALGRLYSYAYFDDAYETPVPDANEPSYEDHVLDLNFKGTNFIRKFRPGNPIGTLGRFVAELHDLPRLPLLFQARAKKFRDLGSEYLNAEFGWIPFVNDVINLGHTQLRIQSELDKLVKNNGIRVKRRSKRELVLTGDEWKFSTYPRPFGWVGNPSINDTEELKDFYTFGPYNSGVDSSISGETILSWRHSTEVVTWFVGTFTYYVPDIGSSKWTDRAKAVLSGLVVTPNELWQVYPWTWLADWFGNVGTILSNLSANAVDNEVFENLHVMETITDRLDVEAFVTWDFHEQEIGGVPFTAVDPGSEKVSYSHIEKQKLRQKASPYGFGLNYADFSFRQKSILAALALSRKSPSRAHFGF